MTAPTAALKCLITAAVVIALSGCGTARVENPVGTGTVGGPSSPASPRTFLPSIPPTTPPAIPKSPSDPLPAVTVSGEVVAVRESCLELSTDAGPYAVVGEHGLAVGDVATVRGRADPEGQSPCGPFVLTLIEVDPG